MQQFRFRLQKLLNLEDHREQQAKIRLQSLTAELHGQEKILYFLQNSLYQNQKHLVCQEALSSDAQTIMLYQNYITALNKKIAYQTKRVADALEEVEKSRNELISTQRNRKMLSKLKEKNKKEYTIDMRKTEIKQLDDISGVRQFLRGKIIVNNQRKLFVRI